VAAPKLIVAGASWGGLEAIGALLSRLPADFDVPIAIAQHRGRDVLPDGLSAFLAQSTSMRVMEAGDKDAIEPGHVYVAPADYHLLVQRGSFALSVDERVQYARPSVDVLFESAADAYGDELVAVVLTGANEDGAAGARAVKARGGKVVIQDPATAERRDMPEAALAAVQPDAILAVDDIGSWIAALAPEDSEVARG
jgi:two-component system, chemotaxis family, protein-glutamate methylesterase/glutaminase